MEAVIFDMDGVLIDTEPVSKAAFKVAFEKNGLFFDEDIYQSLMGRSLADIMEDFTANWDAKVAEKVIADRNDYFFSYYEKRDVDVKCGIRRLLPYLKNHGYKIAVATSSTQEVAEKFLKQGGIYNYFDAYVFGSDVVHSKPNPEIFLKAAQKLGVNPSFSYVVEDAQAGLIAAHVGGFQPIFIPESALRSELKMPFVCRRFQSASAFHLALIQSKFEASPL